MSKKNGATSLPGPQEFQFPQPKAKVSWGKFFYNKEEGSYLGRTPKSWSQILIFYVILYALLAALFAICMKVMLNTLDDNQPKWQLENSIIGTNPGLGYRPMSENETERGSVIKFNKAKGENTFWVKLLDNFLESYIDRQKQPDNGVNGKVCGFNDTDSKKSQYCTVSLENYGPCQPGNAYGFNNSQPCIFLKLNKIYGWEPEFYDKPEEFPEDMPEDLRQYIKKLPVEERKQVWVSCSGQFGIDKESVNNIEYYPTRGFPSYYYPYRNQPGYLSPLVAVQFTRPTQHELLNVVCRAWAKNIIFNDSIRDRKGSVSFQLVMD